MKKIYLDQNKWIDLARTILNPSHYKNYKDVAERIQGNVEKGEWIFPISMIHFFETCARVEKESRTRLASVMASISKNYSIASFLDVQRDEFINCFAEIHDKSKRTDIQAVQKNLFGAIGGHPPVLRTASHIPHDTQEKLQELFIDQILRSERLFEDLMRNFNDDKFSEDMQREDQHFKKIYQDLQKEFQSAPQIYRYRAFLAISFVDAFAMHYQFLMNVFGRSREDIIPDSVLGSKEKAIDFLESIPSLDVRIKLLYHCLNNPERLVHKHDHRDIAFLSTAIPYTDLIITERTWKHFAKSAKLDQKYSVTIESDLNFLNEL